MNAHVVPLELKFVLVGEAPSRDGVGGFRGRSGKRLASYMGISHERLFDLFDVVNVFDRFLGRVGKGDAWDRLSARANGCVFREQFVAAEVPVVVMAGKRVADALGFPNATYFAERFDGRTAFVCVPHPSGINRWWNDSEHARDGKAALRSLAQQAENFIIRRRERGVK